MKPVACGLLIALLFCGFSARGQGPDSRGQSVAKLTQVALTSDHPTGFFLLDPKTLEHAPPILALTISKVVNTGLVGLGISVYLSFQPAPSTGAKVPPREEVLIGNFSLYPPDHPAGFLLRTSGAFQKLQAADAVSKSSEVRLLIKMKRIHEKQPWTPVELVIAPPEWRQDMRK